MKLLTILLALLLCGCNTIPRIVKVPIEVPCSVEKPDAPEWATKHLTPKADVFDKVKALLAERRQRMAYESLLEAAVDACQPQPARASSK